MGTSRFNLVRIIHEGFYCNRLYAAVTSLTADGLAGRLSGLVTNPCE